MKKNTPERMTVLFGRLLPKPFVSEVHLAAEDERAFQREIALECRSAMRHNWPLLMLIYLSFILIDMVLMPDVAFYNIVSRLCLVPVLVALIFQFRGEPGSRIDMVIVLGFAVVICAQFMLFSASSSAPYAFCYAILAPIVPISAFVSAPLTLKLNQLFSLACNAVVILVVLGSDFPTEVKIVTPLFIMSVSTLVYYGAISREAIRRHIFADKLRETDRRELAEDAANHDSLTGLYNRRAMENRIETTFAPTGEALPPTCVLMIDIDYFKIYNDTFGHMAGDDCLRQVAGALRAHARQGSFCARFGGEEFILICENCEPAAGRLIGERLVEAVAALGLPHVAPVPGAVVTVSVGYACARGTDITIATLMEQADAALYEAKRLGRNRVCGTCPQSGAESVQMPQNFGLATG